MNKIINSDALDALRKLPDSCCRTCITSPPYYGLRDYGTDGQIGLENTPDQYIENLVKIFREVRRVLKDDGTLWVNIGDSYTQKNLNGIPWLLAFALRSDGWYLRSDIIWQKPNAMPESVLEAPEQENRTPEGAETPGHSGEAVLIPMTGPRTTVPPWSGKATGSRQTKAEKGTGAVFGRSPPGLIRAHTSPHSQRNS